VARLQRRRYRRRNHQPEDNVWNLRAAKTLGIELPSLRFARADRVIE
jgi:hypothetical protein